MTTAPTPAKIARRFVQPSAPRAVRLRFGLAAWSNAHFEHTLYPLRTLHAEYLPRYATKFDCVEADLLHHRSPEEMAADDVEAPAKVGLMDAAELCEWVDQTPKGFLFLPKMHKSVTHGVAGDLLGKAKKFMIGLEPLRQAGRLGPILLQFPAKMNRESGAQLMQDVLRLDDAGTFAVEVRDSSWFTPAFENLLEDFDAPLVWSTWPKAFAPPWATASKGYVRFTGTNIHVRGRHITAEDRLDAVLEIRKRLVHAKWKECFVIVTNPFEGNAVDSLPRIAAALDGPETGKLYARAPGEPMFPVGHERTP